MDKVLEWISEEHPEALKMDGFDDCIVGVCRRFGQEPIIAYDYNKVIDKLVSDGMSYEEALEWHEINQIGAWVGDHTPCFIETPEN